MEIVRIGPDDVGRVYEAEDLFDGPIREAAAGRFLRTEGHHLLLAYMAGRPVGMVTGVEMMHPDKGTEMFLYELGVRADARGRGAGHLRGHGCRPRVRGDAHPDLGPPGRRSVTRCVPRGTHPKTAEWRRLACHCRFGSRRRWRSG